MESMVMKWLVSLKSNWAKQPRWGKLILGGGVVALLVLIPTVSVLMAGKGSGVEGNSETETMVVQEDEYTVAPTMIVAPTSSPGPIGVTSAPSYSDATIKILRSEGVTYEPGNLLTEENGLLLSKGLKSRVLATKRRRVQYHDGGESIESFHQRPDFGACFPVPLDDTENPGGWVYVSNSEMEDEGEGGVGAITFDKDGNVIHYEMILKGTTMNCGGGRTPWNTWVSCEEVYDKGEIYQVDPFGTRKAMKTNVGRGRGRFESFTYDDRNRTEPHFFASEDRQKGALRRFTPLIANWNDPWQMLHGDGTLDFLMLDPEYENATIGKFHWTENQLEAKLNARTHYPESEGIDRDGNQLFLVTKRNKWLFILNLDAMTYSRYSTDHGVFDGAPDQVARALNANCEMLYFTEERGEHSGIHGRNIANQFFTVLEGTEYSRETTGLSFSPDGKRMIFAFQTDGVLFEIIREDGRPFHGKALNVAYHNRAAVL